MGIITRGFLGGILTEGLAGSAGEPGGRAGGRYIAPLLSTFRTIATREARAVPPLCGIACPLGSYVGWVADFPRLRYIHRQPAVYAESLSQDYGGGWVGQGSDYNHNYDPEEDWRAEGFYFWYFVGTQPAEGYAPLYRVEGSELIPAGPAGAFSVEALCYHGGVLWAMGLKYGPPQVRSAEEPDGSWGGPGETVAAEILPDPFIPKDGDAGFRRFNPSTGAWDRVSDTQEVASLTPAFWTLSAGGEWAEVAFPAYGAAEGRGWYSSDAPSVAFYSTDMGLFIQERRYTSQLRPLMKTPRGHVAFRAYRTWLRDNAGALREVGYTAAVGDTGEAPAVLGPASLWTGPAECQQWSGANVGLSSLYRNETRTLVPSGEPIWWRGSFWVGAEDLDGGAFHLARMDRGGTMPLVWTRLDAVAGEWGRDGLCHHVSRIMTASPTGLYWFRGLAVSDDLSAFVPSSDASREYVSVAEGEVVISADWGVRAKVAFAGDEGAFVVGLDLADYPYGADTYRNQGYRSVRESFLLPAAPWFPSREWSVWLRPASVRLFRIGLGWVGDIGDRECPTLLSAALEWCWPTETQGVPTLLSLGAEWADGEGGASPDVGGIGVQYTDGTGANVPELSSAGAEWSAPAVQYGLQAPEVLSAGSEWSDGAAAGEPELTAAGGQWGAAERPSNDVHLSSVGVDWKDTTAVGNSPEFYGIGTEWGMAAAGPGSGERVLHILDVRRSRQCYAVRVTGQLTPAEVASVRVLVRADLETVAVTAWDSYQEGVLDADIMLERPGYQVRVAIIGPDTLPADTDFVVSFGRG